ncbi:MAG: exodeoxyribonuclease VII small subunit [Thermoanaerobaculia bacterium]
MSARKVAATPDEPSFTVAIEELEAILARIENEEVDVDRLATELERAALLLELCRGKIRKAELEVTEIVQRLEAPAAADDETPT